MLTSFPSSRTKQHLLKDQNSCIIILIGICCFLGCLLLYFGSQELYKFKTLIIRHCQVKTFDVKHERQSYFPRWNITIIYKNETIDDFLRESVGTRSERWAWTTARKYKINETYLCYHSRNETSIIQWGWQWNQPIELKAYAFLLFAVIFFIIAIVLLIWRQYFKTKLNNTQQPRQLSTLLANEEQQLVSSLQESSRSTYNKSIKRQSKF
ncbi:unnamed protein product [Adineta steineri]|uniref:Uncharacterized protein n=1 Tax=Adineta steineri TaxID=433720 RepID=A0A814DGZ9_9BILA|nr:unnamed protein product [Adineta steineri]CAF3731685.1 unnamed protein product [Adineta steineri]